MIPEARKRQRKIYGLKIGKIALLDKKRNKT